MSSTADQAVNTMGIDPDADARVQAALPIYGNRKAPAKQQLRRAKRNREVDREPPTVRFAPGLSTAVLPACPNPVRDVHSLLDRTTATAASSQRRRAAIPAQDHNEGSNQNGTFSRCYPSKAELYKKYPQSNKQTYKVVATFDNVLPTLLKEGWLDAISSPRDTVAADGTLEKAYDAKLAIRLADDEYNDLLDEIPRLLQIDFWPLRDVRHDYASQEAIPQSRIDMLGAAFLHYGDLGLVARFCDGEYLGDWRDKDAIVEAVAPHVSAEDLGHIIRILDLQTPAEFNWEEPANNKAAFLRKGNSPSLDRHPDVVTKTLNKEERNHHLMPFPGWVARFSAHAHHVKQTILMKAGKKARLIWDGTDKSTADEITMNDVTNTAKEAAITFGCVYMAFCVWIYNLRVSYPSEEIYLAFIDISSCFRWQRIAPDLIGAFGFVIGSVYFAANAMVFGSVVSASTWEPFRRAIAALALVYYLKPGLVAKHRQLLELVKWDAAPGPDVVFSQAKACSLNQGVLNTDGSKKPTPHFIYVDDNLLADVRAGMPLALAAAAEAIFVVLGFPALAVRQCAVALDKWRELFVCYKLVLLGLEFNTRSMTVGIPDSYRQEVCDLLNNHWHEHRKQFDINELEVLVGKLGRIGQAYRSMYHLMGSLYKSVAFCLNRNASYQMTVSRQFRELIARSKAVVTENTPLDDVREIRFATQQAARRIHRCKRKYTICKSLREELDFLRRLLNDSSVPLRTHLGHIVPRDPDFIAAGDSCTEGGGGWSTSLRFWWHLDYASTFSAKIVQRASKQQGRSRDYISINVLETIVVIINFAAAMFACYVDGVDMSLCPVLLNLCDNTSACSWINKKCRDSLIGRRLGRLFAGMLIGSELGIQCEWLSTHDNEIADDISRIKKATSGSFDYSQLLIKFPCLQTCRKFHPSDALLSMILSVLDNGALPDPLTIAQLTPQTLGSFSF